MDPYGDGTNAGESQNGGITEMGVNKDVIHENITQDTLMEDLLNQLPSRQMDRVVEMASQSLKRRRASIAHTRSLVRKDKKDVPLEAVRNLHGAMSDDEMSDNLDGTLRTIPTTLSRKRQLKRQMSYTDSPKIGRCRSLQYRLAMGWQHFKDHMKSAMGLFELWRSHLLTIEGYFGTSVVSYFIFLQWVLLINIPLFLVTGGFLVIPQLLYRFKQKDPPGYDDGNSFSGKELLTGSGFFEKTEMYYGFYTNETVEVIDGMKYEMKYAYLLTCGGYYLFCFIILGYIYLRSYRKYYIESTGDKLSHCNIVFCGWDYSITNLETSQLKNKSIYNELKEWLSGIKFTESEENQRNHIKEKAKVWLQRIAVWIVVLGLLALSGYATYITSIELSLSTGKANETSIPVVSSLAMPVVISSLHLVVPMLFTFLEAFETYSQPKYRLYIHMFRDMALRVTTLGVLIYFWYDVAVKDVQCWETFIGQEIYRLVIVDLFFTLAYSFFMEFFRKLLSLKWTSIERAEFAIARHTLELIYSQSLCWIGVFFSPLLPAIVILKLIMIFYVKRFSVVQNCKSSLQPWRASNTHTVFVGCLFFFFMMSGAAAGLCIFLIEPSVVCGPYKNYENSYEVIKLLIDEWKEEDATSKAFFDFIVSPGLIAFYFILLSVILYFMRTIMLSHKAVVEQLKTQVIAEGRDKRFLINLLNQIKQRGERLSKHPGPKLAKTIESMATSKQTGKVFVRSAAETIMSSGVR